MGDAYVACIARASVDAIVRVHAFHLRIEGPVI